MEYDLDKIDEAALALLALTLFPDHAVKRAWKGMDWGVLDRLEAKGWIADAKGKAKSVMFTEEGERIALAFLEKHFSK